MQVTRPDSAIQSLRLMDHPWVSLGPRIVASKQNNPLEASMVQALLPSATWHFLTQCGSGRGWQCACQTRILSLLFGVQDLIRLVSLSSNWVRSFLSANSETSSAQPSTAHNLLGLWKKAFLGSCDAQQDRMPFVLQPMRFMPIATCCPNLITSVARAYLASPCDYSLKMWR